MLKPSAGRWLRWLGVSLAVLLADLATKAWVTRAFTPGEIREVTPFFNLVLVHNSGAAFSFLAGADGWQRWFFTIVTVVIAIVLLVMLKRHHATRLLAFALALLIGGALGNLWDRVSLGHVVDFVQLHVAGYYWPAFNVADSAISVGVVLLLWDSVYPAGEKARAARGVKP
ncbi:MAG TPA: signal peptidase II [Usitatibacter sp.]|nr:signal peptidase II [Usitatibacter sp.]